MSWFASEFRDPTTSRRRAIAWRCSTNRRIEVRHCGHPTALRPYFIVLDGADTYPRLGAFRLLTEAQTRAELLTEEERAHG